MIAEQYLQSGWKNFAFNSENQKSEIIEIRTIISSRSLFYEEKIWQKSIDVFTVVKNLEPKMP